MENRNDFLAIDYKIKPYLLFHRGPSTSYYESNHVKNANTKLQLNILWRCDGLVTAQIFNEKETNPFNKYTEVFRSHSFNSKKANELLEKICIEEGVSNE